MILQRRYKYVLDEDLIKWGWPEDVWFHVDKVSSAHVYLRLKTVKIVYVNVIKPTNTYFRAKPSKTFHQTFWRMLHN